MAKKKTFGTKEEQASDNQRKAKVIVAQKTANNKYGYKEAIIDEEKVQEFINKNKD